MTAERPYVGSNETIGVVGLGLVGRALGQRLTSAGHRLLGFDPVAEARAAWSAAGHAVAPSLAELAQRCARVVLAVFDTAGVLQVVEGAGGLLSGGAVSAVIDCSTGDPEALQSLGLRLAALGIDLLEAPLSGSSEQIATGSATMLLGASAAALERHALLLDALAPQRIHVGGAGMGARAKLATNLVLGLNRAALAEGMVFAERLGIAPETFLALVLATPARSDAALVKGQRMVDGDFTPQSRIRQHLKDVQLILAAAQTTGQRLPLSIAHARLLQAAVDHGDGDLDNAAILRQLRRESS
jgi:3-hydroxyisobutyrate dehydrogenase-like beta-hydroxyacid dehydrogenase